jgi:8-oxo-dGTP pyrophosphatase MutT (NUDIX family)
MRVIANVEKSPGGKHVWGLPGGRIDSTDSSPWKAAIRELREETNIIFKPKYWDKSVEKKFTIGCTRFYLGLYTDPNIYDYKKST